jgi:hypothetical protein
MPELPPSFMARVRKSTSGCWHWTGPIDVHGYGQTNRISPKTGRWSTAPAHRWAYEHVNSALPGKGEPGHMQVDHECHNRSKSCKGGSTCLHRRCVNPAHLAAKTPKDNSGASRHTIASRNRAKTHCERGHELSGDNLRERNGKRWCHACHIETSNEARRQRKEADRPEDWERRYWQTERTHCPAGHPYGGDNLYVAPTGARGCRTCRNARASAHREQHIQGVVPRGNRADWTHCKHGHELSGDNLYVAPSSGKRSCKTCRRAASRKKVHH